MVKQVLKLDREGWAVFTGVGGSLHIGTIGKSGGAYMIRDLWATLTDTPANREKAVSIWKANSFAREVKGAN